MNIENRSKPFSKLPKVEKLRRAKEDFKGAMSADTRFQQRARLGYRFYAGDQYTHEERDALRKAGRPDLVCNLVKPTVELVKGVNEQNRVTVQADATEKNDGFLADILNDVYDKIREIEDIEMQEDDALENCAITGRGFCAVDVAPDPKRPGEIKIPVISIPPSEIRLDPAGKKDDLSDCRFVYWHKWVTLEDFAIKYPDAMGDIEDVINGESVGDFMDLDPDQIDDMDDFSDLPLDTPKDEDYSRILDTGFYDRTNGHIRVVHMEYWDVYDRYYAVNPMTGEMEEFDGKALKKLEQAIPGFQYETIKDKKVNWFQFTGHKVLYDGDSPIPYDGFSICAEFAYKDKSNENITHFGIVQDMIDPQREANKRWSQTLNLYLGQSQGGYLIEQDAILDQQHWDDTINAPGEDTVVAAGAIAGNKILPKQMPQLPTGALQMHDMAKDLIKQVSGVNPDLLGLSTNRQEPGVVIRLRQQQGMVLLAKLFKNHHRMQEQLAQRVFAIIMKYMPDSQIQRILGDREEYIFRGDLIADTKNGIIAPIRNIRDLKYNINTDESASNMTKTMAQLAIFMEMMSKGFPTDPKAVIARLDLPESEKLEWIQFVEQQQQRQAEMQQAEMQMKQQESQGKLQIEMQKLQANTAKDGQKLQLDGVKAAAENRVDMMTLSQRAKEEERDFMIELAKLDMEQQKLVWDLIGNMTQAAKPVARGGV